MIVLVHLLLFLLSAAIVWLFAGRLIESVDRVAKRFKQSEFTVAFFVLGFLTSIGEISVMVNSTINGVPQVSAGNLVGASIVILLFLVPFLAILGNGVHLKNTLNNRHLAFALFVIALPALCLLDGDATKTEGLTAVLVYVTLLYFIRSHGTVSVPVVIEKVTEGLAHKRHTTTSDGVNIAGGGLLIFLAGNVLVRETVYFSVLLGVPSSIIGLLVLSIGTNLPELVIAARAVHKEHKDIAFGNYVGSSLANTLVFGCLALLNGAFTVERSEFMFAGIVIVAGFIAFYLFAKSNNRISRPEGIILMALYAVFVVVQIMNFVKFATD